MDWILVGLAWGFLLGLWAGAHFQSRLWREKADDPMMMCSGGRFYQVLHEHAFSELVPRLAQPHEFVPHSTLPRRCGVCGHGLHETFEHIPPEPVAIAGDEVPYWPLHPEVKWSDAAAGWLDPSGRRWTPEQLMSAGDPEED